MRREIPHHPITALRLFSTSILAALAICIASIGLISPQRMSGQTARPTASAKRGVVKMDRATLHQFLRSAGYRTRGGIGRATAESTDPSVRSFPHFSSSFTVKGVTYPFTMLGYPPKSGRKAAFRSVVVPLRMHFIGFGPNGDINVDFDPAPAVTNLIHSPMYRNANFVNGYGQFGEMMQRAAFWNKMDENRSA